MKIRVSTVFKIASAVTAVAGVIVTGIAIKKALDNEAHVSAIAEDDSEVVEATKKNLNSIATPAIILGSISVGFVALGEIFTKIEEKCVSAQLYKHGVGDTLSVLAKCEGSSAASKLIDYAANKMGKSTNELIRDIAIAMVVANFESMDDFAEEFDKTMEAAK